jgi:hypothetical protein
VRLFDWVPHPAVFRVRVFRNPTQIGPCALYFFPGIISIAQIAAGLIYIDAR